MQRKTNSPPTPLCTHKGRKRSCLASCFVHALCATLAFALASDAVPSAHAQNAGVEFTLFPANQNDGQMYVSRIAGVSSTGDVAALHIRNSPGYIAWWRRGQGITLVPPESLTFNGSPVLSFANGITADGVEIVGLHQATGPSGVFFYNDAEGLRSIGPPTTLSFGSSFFGPIVTRLFAPTTQRVVASVQWDSRVSGPPEQGAYVWTPATSWQRLLPSTSIFDAVVVTGMSDNGISIGYIDLGGYGGPRYEWKHDPATGVTFYGTGNSQNYTAFNGISRDGQSIAATRFLGNAIEMAVITNGVQRVIPLPWSSQSEAWAVSNDGSVVTGYAYELPPGMIPGIIQGATPFVSGIEYLQSLGVTVPENTRTASLLMADAVGSVHFGNYTFSNDTFQSYILNVSLPSCDPIDFNNDGLFPTDEDVIDFLTVLAGGTCSNEPNCFDIDFNNDGLFPSDEDLIAFLRVFAGGNCS